MVKPDLLVGLMSGTSLDGVDAVVADLSRAVPRILSHAHVAFEPEMRAQLLALTVSGFDEIDSSGRLGNVLAAMYAQAVFGALSTGRIPAASIRAIGCHGQTVRHRPELGFTLQLGNPALLAELTGIAVVADFRSRDVAAGGQGAPLVPAFHAATFADPTEDRAILNLGGIGNITLLPRGAPVRGFDTGPGNCLMDHWAQRHLHAPLDAGGAWAAGGTPLPALLATLLREPFFDRAAPKSCGRELFNDDWLGRALEGSEDPRAVQATLLELTVETVARSIEGEKQPPARLIVCGGGARNDAMMARLARRLAPISVETSARHGIDVAHVEATAFAWLAQRTLQGQTGSLFEVTGARGPRVLGAIYPA